MSAHPQSPKQKTEEQIHYESLASYLKYIVGIAGSLIAAIAIVAIFFTFSDRESMRKQYEETVTQFQNQMSELKKDANETTKAIKDDSKSDIKISKENTNRQLNEITTQTRSIALKQTNDQISEIFKSDKIQSIIEYQATQEIKKKVNEMVADETKNFLPINDAASSMREGSKIGMIRLRGYFLNSNNSQDSLRAKRLYNQILEDYKTKYSGDYDDKQIDYVNYKIFELLVYSNLLKASIPKLDAIKIINHKLPKNNEDKLALSAMVEYAKNGNDLNGVALITIILSRISGIHFEFFNENQVNKWYDGLQP